MPSAPLEKSFAAHVPSRERPRQKSRGGIHGVSGVRNRGMTTLILIPIVAAAGKALLVYMFGGSFGLAVLAFFVFKAMGK